MSDNPVLKRLPNALASIDWFALTEMVTMNLDVVYTLLALAPPAQPGQPQPPIWVSMAPMIFLMIIFYFVLIRPQSKKAKQHTELLKTLKSGDRVMTSGGIIGVVITVKDKLVTIRSADSKLEIQKSAVQEVLERGSGTTSES